MYTYTLYLGIYYYYFCTLHVYRCVEGNNLFVCGTYIYNHYVDCKDTNYYLSSDKVNDVLCLPPEPGAPLCPILACQDNTLRVLKVCETLKYLYCELRDDTG